MPYSLARLRQTTRARERPTRPVSSCRKFSGGAKLEVDAIHCKRKTAAAMITPARMAGLAGVKGKNHLVLVVSYETNLRHGEALRGRPGQTKVTWIYRLVTCGSFEETIMVSTLRLSCRFRALATLASLRTCHALPVAGTSGGQVEFARGRPRRPLAHGGGPGL